MDIFTLSPIILILLVIIIIILTKKILQVIGFTLIIILLASFVTGFFLYRDIQDFKENFVIEEKLFLLGEEENYIAGFTMGSNEIGVFLNNEMINNYESLTNKEILDENYKLLLFSEDSFENLKRVYINDQEFKKIEFFEVIESDNSLVDASRLMDLDKEEFKFMFDVDDDSATRSLFFGIMVSEAIQQDSSFVIKNIKSKTINIYPETILFRLIKFIPDSIFNNVLKGIDIKEKVMK